MIDEIHVINQMSKGYNSNLKSRSTPLGAVWSGFMLFVVLSKLVVKKHKKNIIVIINIFVSAFHVLRSMLVSLSKFTMQGQNWKLNAVNCFKIHMILNNLVTRV